MDHFIAYKQALKKKYETEKTGKHSSFLIKPTSAKLRNLCIQILKNSPSSDDLQTFHNFFGFAFEETNLQKIKNETEKFKPVATFLRGETEISDYNSIAADIVAILVNFPSRPYAMYLRSAGDYGEPDNGEEKSTDGPAAEEDSGGKPDEETVEKNSPEKKKISEEKTNRKIWEKWKNAIAMIIVVIATAVVVKVLTKDVQCLTWKTDHYELVDCDGNYAIIPYREDLLEFKKIQVSDTTTFFKDRQPIVWYSKQDNVYEYFNADGVNPVTGKELNPISTYIIQNQILKE